MWGSEPLTPFWVYACDTHTHTAFVTKHGLGSKQAHRATHWSRVHSLSASAGVWPRTIESEISVAPYGPSGLG